MQTPTTQKTKAAFRGFVLALLALLILTQTGCETARIGSMTGPLTSVTGCVWNGQARDDFQPAHEAKIHLFESPKNDDVLVQYEERNFRNNHRKTRAYFLFANQSRVTGGKRPNFVNLDNCKDLMPAPIYRDANSRTNTVVETRYYAFSHDRHWEFELRRGDTEIGTFKLPVYHDINRMRVAGKILITPAAAALDTGIGAGFVGASIAAHP